MKYNTYLFDFDYTLVNSSTGIVKCFRIVLERHGHTEASDEQIRRTIGKTLEESFSILTGITDPDVLYSYRKEYVAEADKYMTANTFLFPETKEVLTRLKESGAKLGIISTKYKYRIKEFLDLNFPESFFDIIIGIEEVEHYKPSPEGIIKAINSLNSKKKNTLYIGDSIADAEAAQNAEVDFVGVTHGVTTTKELAHYHNVAIIPTLSPLLSLCAKKSFKRHIKKDALYTLERYFTLKQRKGSSKTLDIYKHYVCRNCGTYYIGEYCNNCGQPRNTRRFTFDYVIRNMLGGIMNIDNGFARNLVELLYRPGYMIYDYIKGKRSQYFKPFQTLFVLAAIYIIIVQVTDPLSFMKKKELTTYNDIKSGITAIKKQATNDSTKLMLTKSYNYLDSAYSTSPQSEKGDLTDFNIDLETNSKASQFITTFVKRLTKLFNRDFTDDKQNPTFIDGLLNIIENWTKNNKSLSLITLIPLYAFATKRSFRRNAISQKFNCTEHLFAQVYISCQLVLISILLLPIYGHSDLDDAFGISWWMIFLLYWWDNKQLFQETWKSSFKLTVFMFINVAVIFLILALMLILITAILTAALY